MKQPWTNEIKCLGLCTKCGCARQVNLKKWMQKNKKNTDIFFLCTFISIWNSVEHLFQNEILSIESDVIFNKQLYGEMIDSWGRRKRWIIQCWPYSAMKEIGTFTWWRHQIETFSALLAFLPGIHRSPVNSPHKSQWCGDLMFSLICAWIKGWVNYREAGDLRHHRAHYDVTVMRAYKVSRGHVSVAFEVL